MVIKRTKLVTKIWRDRLYMIGGVFLCLTLFFKPGFSQIKKSALTKLQPTNLRVDLLAHPARIYKYGLLSDYRLNELIGSKADSIHYAAINSRFPGFSWVVPDLIKQQSAFQIQIATNIPNLQNGHPDVWESKKIISPQNINATYSGPALQPLKTYYWRVRVWNKNNPTRYSAIQAFRTGDSLADYCLPSLVLIKTKQSPVQISEINNRVLGYDFGKDAFCQPYIEINGRNNKDSIHIRLGEKLLHNGRIDTTPPGTVRYRQLVLPIQKGDHNYPVIIPSDRRNTGPNSIKMPSYIGEVMPFRFMEIIGDLTNNTIKKVGRSMVHTDFDDQSTTFTSADSTLNKVWKLCKYTIKATSFSGYYVDGDRERIPYEADALINQLSHYSSDATFNTAKRTLDYLITHPTWPTEWSLQNLLIAYNDYMYSGDTRNLTTIYNDLRYKVLTTLEGKNGLISTQTGRQSPEFLKSIHYRVFDGNPGLKDIVDWPHTNLETDGFVFTKYNAVVNSFYYAGLHSMIDIASALNHPKDVLYYTQKASEVKNAFIANFVNAQTGLIIDGIGTNHSSLHANMFALAFGLVPKDHINIVLDFIRSRGVRCSVYGAQFLLEALGTKDSSGYALKLITSNSPRSWVNMLNEGATMTMEAWGQSYKPNQDWNHAWGTAPANYIVRHLMGIQPLKPAFEQVQIKPHPGHLKNASIKYTTIRGIIRLSFNKHPSIFQLQLELPGNTTGTVYLPFSTGEKVIISMDNKPVKALYENGYWCIADVGSGMHKFEVRSVLN